MSLIFHGLILGQTALVKFKICCFIIWLLSDEAEEHLGRGLSGVIARMALTMAVLLALPSYLLLMAKQRAAGVIKTTTNNPVLNCQYQIGGKRPYKNLQKLHKSGGIVVNLYEENLFAIAAGEIVAKSFPIFSDYHRRHFWQQKSQMVKWSSPTISFAFSAVQTSSAGR